MTATAPERRLVLTLAALALLVRLARCPTPQSLLLGNADYDPAVMYTAAASLLHGHLPYRDVIFVHPPGVLLGMAPFALLGRVLGDAEGLALARLTVMLLGVLNTVLVCALLRRHGPLAVAAGGGLYAAWAALAFPEQLPLLEPFLMTALLLALLLARARHPRAHVIAGVVLGVAVMVKVWAFVDVLLVAGLVLSRYRSRGLVAFAGGVAAGGSAVGLPFFVAAPAAMWDKVVAVQLGRPRDAPGLLQRAGLFGPDPGQEHPAYLAAMAVVVVGLLALALAVVVAGVRGGRAAARDERVWWALIALTHAALLAAAPSFYDHYAHFLAGPLTLVVGIAIVRWPRRSGAAVPSPVAAVAVVVVATALASIVVSLMRFAATPLPSAADRAAIGRWADAHRCVWASVQHTVLFDHVSDSLDRGCELTVDWYGRNLLANAHDVDLEAGLQSNIGWGLLIGADGVILRSDPASWPMDEAQREEFHATFPRAQEVGAWTLRDRGA